MASIGAVSCDYVRGDLGANRQRVRTWQVAGLDGYGAKRMGAGDSQFAVEVVKRGTSAQCNTFRAAIEALAGQIVSIVNDWGDTFTYCLITKIGPPRKTAEIRYGGACVRIRIEGVRKI